MRFCVLKIVLLLCKGLNLFSLRVRRSCKHEFCVLNFDTYSMKWSILNTLQYNFKIKIIDRWYEKEYSIDTNSTASWIMYNIRSSDSNFLISEYRSIRWILFLEHLTQTVTRISKISIWYRIDINAFRLMYLSVFMGNSLWSL